MFRWFRKPQDVPRVAGRTATEWYHLQRFERYRPQGWESIRAQAVQEIVSSVGSTFVRMADVVVSDASEAARCVAAIQLSFDPGVDGETALIAALQDESEPVRRTVAASLEKLGSVRALTAVVGGSRHGRAVRTHAAHRLAAMKPGEAIEAIPALMVLLQYSAINWRTHHAAVNALRVIGKPAIPTLVHALHRGSYQLRLYSALALKDIGVPDELLPQVDEIIRKAGLSGDDDTELESPNPDADSQLKRTT